MPVFLFAQKEIQSKVVDNTNFLLPGASIVIKGTTKGTVTNMDGSFNLKVDKIPAVLVVSYLGFVTKEVKVSSSSNITVQLESDQESLDEVVVIGYGSVNKKILQEQLVP